MKKFLGLFLIAALTMGAATRTQQADTLISADATKTWTLPSAADTLVGRTSTDTLTNKTISGSSNTFSSIPSSAITPAVLSNPMTTGGDIIYGGASGTATRLANGSSGQVLTSAGGTSAPSWQTPSGGASTETRGLYNFGISAGSGSPANSISFTVTQADGATAPTSGNPVIFSTATNYPYGASSLSITSTLSITIPGGGTLGLNPTANFFIYIYLINNGGSPDICVTGVNPFVPNGFGQTTDLMQTSLVVTGQISSSSNVAGAVYCATKSSGAAPAQLVARAYAQTGILNSSNNWTTSVNGVTVSPNLTKFYASGAYSTPSAIVLSSSSAHTFTIPSSSVTAGAVYSSAGNYYIASNTIASSTSLVMASLSGFVTPTGTGTLTLVSGTGPSSIAYTAVANSRPVLSTAATVNYVSYVRDGDMIDAWINYYSTATLTGAAAGTGDYIFQLPFPINTSAVSGSGGGAYVGGSAQTSGIFFGITAVNQYKLQAWGVAEVSATNALIVSSAVPYYAGAVSGSNLIPAYVRVVGAYQTNTAITDLEVPIGSSFIPAGSNVSYNFHVRYPASNLGIYGP